MKSIDINCDMGESFGNFKIGNDEAVFPFITSSNIACGFHGGDPVHMEHTIGLAIKHGVQIGAHPGFPDLSGFGRRKIDLSPEDLRSIIKYQLAAISGMAKSLGTAIKYVKPHGALYNLASDHEITARSIINAVGEINASLPIMGLAGSQFQTICEAENIPFIAEAFADRAYQANGRLLSRSQSGSVLTDPAMVAQQVLSIVVNQQVTAHDGTTVPINAQSVCVHGDNPSVVSILKAIDESLETQDIVKISF
jgi:UPF0271 protein